MARKAGGIKIDISANLARLSADMTKAVGILGGFERQVNALGRNMKMALGGAIFAGVAIGIKQLNKSIFDLAEAGDKAGDIQAAFERLGGSSKTIEKASDATQGLIEKFDLMKAANTALIKGIPDVNNNFAQLAELATKVASARDLNPFETLTNLIDAVGSGKARGLKEFAIDIGDAKGQVEGTAAALNDVPNALQKFDPVTLGVADSVQVLKNTLADLNKNIGIGVDTSPQLAAAITKLRVEADPERMQQFGAALANVEGAFISIATSALPTAIKLLDNFANGLDIIFTLTPQRRQVKALTDVENEIAKTQERFRKDQENYNNPNLLQKIIGSGPILRDMDAQSRRLIELEQKRTQVISEITEQNNKAAEEREKQKAAALEKYLQREAELRKKYGLDSPSGKYNPSANAGNSAQTEKAQKQFAELAGRDFKAEIENAIEKVDVKSFENLKVELYASTRDSFLAANRELVTARIATEDQLQRLAEKKAIETVESYETRMSEAQYRLGEQLKQRHEDAVQSWSGFVDNLFNADQFDPTAALKDLAKGFVTELLAGLAGGLDQNAQSFYGIGRIIAQGFTETTQSTAQGLSGRPSGAQNSNSGWGAIINGIGSIFSSAQGGMSFAGTAQTAAQNAEWNAAAMEAGSTSSAGAGSGASGAGLSAAQAGGIVAAIQTISAGISAGGIDQKGKDNTGTGGAIGTGIGGTIGAIFGGPMGASIGAQIGNIAGSMIGGMFKWGPQNPETNARHAFANFVEEGFKKLSTVSFFDAQRRLQTTNAQNFNFLEGPTTRFNDMGDAGANWADNFQAMGSEAVTVFSGLGEAMEEVLGLTEDVGSQIGYLLAVNLGGNIDNARLLVQQLGLDLEKMTEALIEAGRSGEMTWLEVEVAIQGVTQAFGEGLVAVGDVAGAFEELIGSGGRGVAALKGVRDLAIEALESGGRTLDDLRARLIAAGQAPEVVDTIIGAIRGRGINSLEELKNANDRVLGGIVADTNARSEVIKRQWEEMDGKIKGFQQTLKELDSQMTKDLTINIKTNFDGNTQQALDQGVFSGTGAEKLTTGPMQTPNTKAAQFKRSVSGEPKVQASNITLNVDARGAERGVHSDVISAMAVMEKRIMTRTADLMYQGLRSNAA